MNIFQGSLTKRQEINNVISSFQENPPKMITLASDYYISTPRWLRPLDRIADFLSEKTAVFLGDENFFVEREPSHCFCLANALIMTNLFNQMYIKAISTFEQFEKVLQDNEEGIYRITNRQVRENGVFFPAHAISVVKFFRK